MLRPRTPRKKLCIGDDVVCGAPWQGEAFEKPTGFVRRLSRMLRPYNFVRGFDFHDDDDCLV
jgi:hypothetical protein